MTHRKHGLIDQAGVAEALDQASAAEEAWVDVIRKMDEVYADLVRHQLELEAKNAELEEAHRFIRSVLTSMNDVLIVCDRRGVIQQVNNALLKLSGRSEAEVLNTPLSELFTPESREKINALEQDDSGLPMSDCEVSLLAANGHGLLLAMNCSPHYDHDGRQQGMVLAGRPVGELRQAYDALHKAHQDLQQTQQQLVQSEKMASLGRLVAGVAHELNNPISFVFGNMHALKRYGERITKYLVAVDGNTDKAQLARLRGELKIDHIINDMSSLIDGTLEGAERVSDIVQDLRRYSGAQSEEVSRFDLVQLIETSVQWVLRAERQAVDLHYQMPARLEIDSRKGHLQQILVNLLQNAVDVMEGQDSPHLEIGCRQQDHRVYITIHDFGPGIAPEALSKLFDPFYTTKPVGKGTGLGLSISYGLAQKIGGELQAENHPRGGALFSLSLPETMEQPNE
jgi:two-component system sensor histidine kinase HupT/HoxJ